MSKVEEVARAIEPSAFRQFESLRDHCLRNGDTEDVALRTAEWAHGHDIRNALEKARAAIKAMREVDNEVLEAMWHAMFVGEFTAHELPMLGAGWESAIDAALREEGR